MKKNKENQKGITLIALIITIIVMLILVIVAMSFAMKGDLFKRAREAADKTEDEANYEKIFASMQLTNTGEIDVAGTVAEAERVLELEGKTVTTSGTDTVVLTVTGKNGDEYKYTVYSGGVVRGELETEKEYRAYQFGGGYDRILIMSDDEIYGIINDEFYDFSSFYKFRTYKITDVVPNYNFEYFTREEDFIFEPNKDYKFLYIDIPQFTSVSMVYDSALDEWVPVVSGNNIETHFEYNTGVSGIRYNMDLTEYIELIEAGNVPLYSI